MSDTGLNIRYRLFYRIGNFVSYTTKASGRMRTRAKMYCVASDRARRENVPRHILFYILTIYFTLRKFYENNDCQFRQMGLQYP